MVRVSSAAATLALAMLFVLSSARAEERTGERIFLVFESEEDAAALEKEALKFQAPVLESKRFVFAGTQEMETIYATCSEEIGTNAQARRECQLRAANRIMVSQVLQLRGEKLGAKAWDVALEVWSPESNSLVWGTTVEVSADSLRLAAREAYPQLAARYLCWHGVDSACPEAEPVVSETVVASATSETREPAPTGARPEEPEALVEAVLGPPPGDATTSTAEVVASSERTRMLLELARESKGEAEEPDLLLRAAQSMIDEDNRAGALAILGELVAAHQAYARRDFALQQLASIAQQAGRNDLASSAATTLLHDHPASRYVPEAFRILGEVFLIEGNCDDARAAFEAAGKTPSHAEHARAALERLEAECASR